MKVDIKAREIRQVINADVANIGTSSEGSQLEERKLRILFLAANPLKTTRLRLDEEIRSIDEAIQKSAFRKNIELNQQWATRALDLQDHILRYTPNLVHFSGHGAASGKLLLENESGL